ncbi:hypothetical protein BT69DRAFT_1324010, partial [Atractiella rhizophila]
MKKRNFSITTRPPHHRARSSQTFQRVLSSIFRPHRALTFSSVFSKRPSQPSSPIQWLPPEILTLIFEFLVSAEPASSTSSARAYSLPKPGRVCLLWYEIISRLWLRNFSCVHTRGTQFLEDYLSRHSEVESRYLTEESGRNSWIRDLTIVGFQTWRDIVRLLKLLKSSNGGKLFKLRMEVPAMLDDDYGLDVGEESGMIAWPTLFMNHLTCLKIEIIRWHRDHRQPSTNELLADHI